MLAKDIMTKSVVTVTPETTVPEIAKKLIDRHISAIPVVDLDGRVLGIVSEGDLMRRPETATEPHHSWWLALLTLPSEDARRYVKTHGTHARDVMSTDVIAVSENETVGQIAALLEKRRIKRVPVIRDGILVGIVSRADLLQGLASSKPPEAPSPSDGNLQEAVERAIHEHAGAESFVNVSVQNGEVRLWGIIEHRGMQDAIRVAAENVPGVVSVEDNTTTLPPNIAALLWAE